MKTSSLFRLPLACMALAKHPLVSDLNLQRADGTTQKLEALKRAQLLFENGKHSFNVQIPLKSK